jgi:aryl-alcohol dehydrogenase-like predicted oxidoreductase
MPRFHEGNVDANLALVEKLRALADAKGSTVAQLAFAWVLARGEDIVPLIGARTRERLKEALGALDLQLDAEDMAALEQAVPPDAVAGERYAPPQLAMLDSEKSAASS